MRENLHQCFKPCISSTCTMKTLYLGLVAIILVIGIVSLGGGEIRVYAFTPSNDLGDGNIFSMTVNGAFFPGNYLEINGNLVTVDPIKITLDNPQGVTIVSKTTFSDRTGNFISELKIPNNATSGTWNIVGTSGIYYKELNFTIADNSISNTCYAGDLCPSVLHVISNATSACCYMPGANSTTLQSPLEQFRTGVEPGNVQCNTDFVPIFKIEDGTYACVQPQTKIQLLKRGWGVEGLTHTTAIISQNDAGGVSINPTNDINNTGTTTIGNRTFYFITLGDNLTTYHEVAAIPFTFHNLNFTLFPSVFSGGPPGSCGNTNFGSEVKFSDGTYEKLAVGIPGYPCIDNYTQTDFQNHGNVQAGLQVYNGKVRLLVSDNELVPPVLHLSLLIDSQYENPAEPVRIDILLNNTSSGSLTLAKSDNWPRNDLKSGMCSNLPIGISILQGNYDIQNMTGAKALVIYQNVPCPLLPTIKGYTFEPQSTNAIQECDTLFSCTGPIDVKAHLEINGFVDNNGQHQSFSVGAYTIVAGDEWGDITIQHFTEADAIAYGTILNRN